MAVEVERRLSGWTVQPDITLMGGDGPVALVEIADSHAPTPCCRPTHTSVTPKPDDATPPDGAHTLARTTERP